MSYLNKGQQFKLALTSFKGDYFLVLYCSIVVGLVYLGLECWLNMLEVNIGSGK